MKSNPFHRFESVNAWALHNKSLDVSGGGGAAKSKGQSAKRKEIPPPRQLNRWPSSFLMRSYKALFAVFITLPLGAACTRLKQYQQTTQTNPVPADTFISLERTGCYGTCPSYTLAISADGTTIFTGSYVATVNGTDEWKKSGVIKSHVTEEQIRQLVSEFDRANYFSLQDRYRDARDGCPTRATDMSSAYTSFQINGRKKSIEHYLGCVYDGGDLSTYPKELFALENSIDRIVNTKQWLQ